MLHFIGSLFFKIFKAILKALILIGACFLFAFVIVYPLWYFAVHKPNIFTITVLLLFGIVFTAYLVAKIKRCNKKS